MHSPISWSGRVQRGICLHALTSKESHFLSIFKIIFISHSCSDIVQKVYQVSNFIQTGKLYSEEVCKRQSCFLIKIVGKKNENLYYKFQFAENKLPLSVFFFRKLTSQNPTFFSQYRYRVLINGLKVAGSYRAVGEGKLQKRPVLVRLHFR